MSTTEGFASADRVKPVAGVRRITPAGLAAQRAARRYIGDRTLAVKRIEALQVAKRAAAALGLKAAKVAMIDNLFGCSPAADWNSKDASPSSRPPTKPSPSSSVYPSLLPDIIFTGLRLPDLSRAHPTPPSSVAGYGTNEAISSPPNFRKKMAEAPSAARTDRRPELSQAVDIGNVSLGLVRLPCPSKTYPRGLR